MGDKERIAAALAQYGESFMSMFSSSDESEDERHDCEDGVDNVAPVGEHNYNDRNRTDAHVTKKQKKKNTNVGDDDATIEEEQTKSLKLQSKSCDDVDRIFETFKDHRDDKTSAVTSASHTLCMEDGVKIKSPAGIVRAEKKKKKISERPEEDGYHLHKLERKRFMASNAEKILDVEATERLYLEKLKKARKLERAAEKQEKEDFRKISREIQSFGATGLDKKAKAKFEQERLVELGAKRQKGIRIPASIGLGMAKKSAMREQRALEESIAAGMVSRKALASKKRREKKSGVDRGLNEDMGSFRNGVLRVSHGKTSIKGRKKTK